MEIVQFWKKKKQVEYLWNLSTDPEILSIIMCLPVGAFPGWVHCVGLAELSEQHCVWLLGGYVLLQ